MTLLEREISIVAPADVVFRHLTEPEGLLRWIAIDARADATPGGELRWTHENGATMAGRFVEVEPPKRLVFRYGWVDDLMGVPPESTLVEIDLVADGSTTILRLTHRELPEQAIDAHARGWNHFLSELAQTLAS